MLNLVLTAAMIGVWRTLRPVKVRFLIPHPAEEPLRIQLSDRQTLGAFRVHKAPDSRRTVGLRPPCSQTRRRFLILIGRALLTLIARATPHPARSASPIMLCAKPLRTKSAAATSGRAKVSVTAQFLLCHPNPVGYGDTPVRPMPRITAGSLLNLFCPIALCAVLRRVLRELLHYSRLFDLGARRAGAAATRLHQYSGTRRRKGSSAAS